MPDIAGAFRIRREMRKRKQDTNRVSTNTKRVSCKDCQWWDPHAESYACSVCPVTNDAANVRLTRTERSDTLLAFAHVGIDPVNERGRVSRGAYIVDESGTQYMTHAGGWTHGITGDHNWWNNWAEASDFLRAKKANAPAQRTPGKTTEED